MYPELYWKVNMYPEIPNLQCSLRDLGKHVSDASCRFLRRGTGRGRGRASQGRGQAVCPLSPCFRSQNISKRKNS